MVISIDPRAPDHLRCRVGFLAVAARAAGAASRSTGPKVRRPPSHTAQTKQRQSGQGVSFFFF